MINVYEWLAGRLVDYEHVEDGPELDKAECQKVLDLINKKTEKNFDLIVNINIELSGVCYDYIIDSSGSGKLFIEEWDNRYL